MVAAALDAAFAAYRLASSCSLPMFFLYRMRLLPNQLHIYRSKNTKSVRPNKQHPLVLVAFFHEMLRLSATGQNGKSTPQVFSRCPNDENVQVLPQPEGVFAWPYFARVLCICAFPTSVCVFKKCFLDHNVLCLPLATTHGVFNRRRHPVNYCCLLCHLEPPTLQLVDLRHFPAKYLLLSNLL